jgi:sulfite exporter TauE/SafE
VNLGVAFLTGLTAGGVGCLAVQGGLLTNSIAIQVDTQLTARALSRDVRVQRLLSLRVAQPIVLFLTAKLVTYTALGFLLGLCGSLLQVTPRARAVTMVFVGLFMLGNGLRLLEVHPLFRVLVISTPVTIISYARRKARNWLLPIAPLLLGSLTVLLPCGVTQAMMAAALATGRPFEGAALLFAFTLGTTPLLFLVAYSGALFAVTVERYFRRILALILITLGTVACLFGLNLAGVPLRLPQLACPAVLPFDVATRPRTNAYSITVSQEGYSPAVLHLPAGKTVTLNWVTGGGACCARSVVISKLAYETILPGNARTPFAIPAQPRGTVLYYSCSTGHRTGQLVFDEE